MLPIVFQGVKLAVLGVGILGSGLELKSICSYLFELLVNWLLGV